MKIKSKIKWIVDLLMTAALLCLMAYQVTGDMLHEWIGAAMLMLFILHNVLNIKWYPAVFKGKYSALRVIRTAVNIGVLASLLCLGFSGIVMLRHVFAALSIKGPMATARNMHMSASYWGFVLMCLHLGFHWGTVIGLVKSAAKGKNAPTALKWSIRAATAAAAAYGLYCFIKADLVSYMLLLNQFVFFDYDKHPCLVFAEYLAMVVLFAAAAYYLAKLLGRIGKKGKRKE